MRSRTDWAAIEAEYLTTPAQIVELAKKYGVAENSIAQKASKYGWTAKKTKATEVIINTVVDACIVERATTLIRDLKQINDSALQDAQKIRSEALRLKCYEMKDVNAFASALEKAQRMERLALGVSTDNSQLTGRDGKDLGAGAMPVITIPENATKAQMRDLALALREGSADYDLI